MSSEFNIGEFRRRRAGDNPQPPETGQLPFAPPAVENGPTEYVPQAAPLSAPMQSIPDAVPNPYVTQPVYAPVSSVAVERPAGVPFIPAMAPAPNPYAAPVPLPEAVPAPIMGSTPYAPAVIAAPKEKSASLIGGLIAKIKASKKPKTAEPVETQFASGPTLFVPDMPVEPMTNAAPVQEAFSPAPIRAAIPANPAVGVPSLSPSDVKTVKSGLPTWAAFALGLMTGVILTFAALAYLAKKPTNSLEAKFGEQPTTQAPANQVASVGAPVADAAAVISGE